MNQVEGYLRFKLRSESRFILLQLEADFRCVFVVLVFCFLGDKFHIQIRAYFGGAQFLVNALNAVALTSLFASLAILLSDLLKLFHFCFKKSNVHIQ